MIGGSDIRRLGPMLAFGVLLAALSGCATGPADDAPKAMVSSPSTVSAPVSAESPQGRAESIGAQPAPNEPENPRRHIFTTPGRVTYYVNVDTKQVIAHKYASSAENPIVKTEQSLSAVGKEETRQRLEAMGVELVKPDRANCILRIDIKLAGGVSMGDLMSGKLGVKARLDATITRDGMVYKLAEGKGIASTFTLPATKKDGTNLIRLTEKESDEILNGHVEKIVEEFFTEHEDFFAPLRGR